MVVVIIVSIVIMLLLLPPLLLLLLTCDPQVSSKQALELRLQVPPPQH